MVGNPGLVPLLHSLVDSYENRCFRFDPYLICVCLFVCLFVFITSYKVFYLSDWTDYEKYDLWLGLVVFNATFDNILDISWRSVLLVKEYPEKNHRPASCHWQTDSLRTRDLELILKRQRLFVQRHLCFERKGGDNSITNHVLKMLTVYWIYTVSTCSL